MTLHRGKSIIFKIIAAGVLVMCAKAFIDVHKQNTDDGIPFSPNNGIGYSLSYKYVTQAKKKIIAEDKFADKPHDNKDMATNKEKKMAIISNDEDNTDVEVQNNTTERYDKKEQSYVMPKYSVMFIKRKDTAKYFNIEDNETELVEQTNTNKYNTIEDTTLAENTDIGKYGKEEEVNTPLENKTSEKYDSKVKEIQREGMTMSTVPLIFRVRWTMEASTVSTKSSIAIEKEKMFKRYYDSLHKTTEEHNGGRNKSLFK